MLGALELWTWVGLIRSAYLTHVKHMWAALLTTSYWYSAWNMVLCSRHTTQTNVQCLPGTATLIVCYPHYPHSLSTVYCMTVCYTQLVLQACCYTGFIPEHWNWGCSIESYLFVQVEYSEIIPTPAFQFQCPGAPLKDRDLTDLWVPLLIETSQTCESRSW